jgi:hypothetical protein
MGWSGEGLTALQRRVLAALSGVPDAWLTGGGALGGFYLHHRRSYDLDFFTSEPARLDELELRLRVWCASEAVELRLERSFPGFRRFRVHDGVESTLVDLVHDAAPQIEAVQDKPVVDGVRLDSLRELRANKLAALLGRAETKDLVDLYALAGAGLPPLEGLEDAARKDGGLDVATLGWVLDGMEIDLEGLLLDKPLSEAELSAFKAGLVEALRRRAFPA